MSTEANTRDRASPSVLAWECKMRQGERTGKCGDMRDRKQGVSVHHRVKEGVRR